MTASDPKQPVAIGDVFIGKKMEYDREASLKHACEMDEIRRVEQRKNDITAAILVIPALAGLVCYHLGVVWITDFVSDLIERDVFSWAALGTFFAGLWLVVRILLKLFIVADVSKTTWQKIKDATPEFDERNSGK